MNTLRKLGLTMICVAVVGCSKTGPDTPKDPTGGKEPDVISSAVNVSSVSTSSEQNNSVAEGGNDPTVPLKFTLNKPLAADAQVIAVYDTERSSCVTDLRPYTPKTAIPISKGTTNFNITAVVVRNNVPEDNCDAAFNLNLNFGDHIDIVKSTGLLHLKDDDTMGDFVESDLAQQESYKSIYLNGDHKYDGTSYAVTQIQGPK